MEVPEVPIIWEEMRERNVRWLIISDSFDRRMDHGLCDVWFWG